MGIEALIYARLSTTTALTALVSGCIYPTTPTEDVGTLPIVVYTSVNALPELTVSGPSTITKYVVEVDSYGINLDTVLNVQAAIKGSLHCYRTDFIQGSFMTNSQTQQEPQGFHGLQTFTVYVTE